MQQTCFASNCGGLPELKAGATVAKEEAPTAMSVVEPITR